MLSFFAAPFFPIRPGGQPHGETIVHKENLNVPLGPVSTSAVWRAQARIQISITSFHIWGHGLPPGGEWYTLISRCTEKGSKFTFVGLQHVIRYLKFDGVRGLVIWTDKGTHYASSEYMGSLLCMLMSDLKINIKHRHGCEKHGKFEIDSSWGDVAVPS